MDNMGGWIATRADRFHTHIYIYTHTPHIHIYSYTHHTDTYTHIPHTHTNTHHRHTHTTQTHTHTHTLNTHHKYTYTHIHTHTHITHTTQTHTLTHTHHTHKHHTTPHTHTHSRTMLVANCTKPTRYTEQPGRALQGTTKTSTPHLHTTRMQFMHKRRKGPQLHRFAVCCQHN